MVLGSFTVLYSGSSQPTQNSGFDHMAAAPSVQWVGNVIINPDGSLSAPSAPISYVNGQYLLTGDINGTVSIKMNYAIFNGDGYNITNYNGEVPLQANSANHVTMMNVNLTSTWAPAIGVYLSSYDTVRNNTVTGMNSGIFIDAPYNSVLNNTVNMILTDPSFTGTPYGISTHASGTDIVGNSVYIPTNSIGIVLNGQDSNVSENSVMVIGDGASSLFSSSASSVISHNNLTSIGANSFGIQLAAGAQYGLIVANTVYTLGNYTSSISLGDGFNILAGNMITTNGNFSKSINIPASGTGSNDVTNNTLVMNGSSSAAIYSNSFNTTIWGNQITAAGNVTYGIDALTLSDISNNSISVNGTRAYGLYSASNDRIVSGNMISVSGLAVNGLYLSDASYLAVSDNTILTSGNHGNATYLSGIGSTLIGNIMSATLENGTGLNLERYSNNNFILNNTVEFSSTGLSAGVTSGNVFTGNNFINDTSLFRFSNTNSNTFYHNNFVNFTTYTVSKNTNSVWDNGYPSGGNYWSNYTGMDLNSGPGQNITGSDGIGDTQFNVSVSNIDHYPLMENWSRPIISFTETGLASGTTWNVSFNSSNYSSHSDLIVIPIANASYTTYEYAIFNVTGYTLDIFGGQIIYTGDSSSVSATYTIIIPPPPPPVIPENYTVSFVQSTLPSQTEWSVTLNGTSLTSDTGNVAFQVPNGTYEYSIGQVAGYSASVGSGVITVNGANVTVNVDFSQVKYTVTFNSLGLPSGMTWYVNFTGGNNYVSTGSSITAQLPNGTYHFTVSNVSGYNVSVSSDSVTVNGANPSPVTVSYTVQNNTTPDITPSGNAGFDPWIYLILGIVVGAVVVTAVLEIYHRRK